MSIISIPYNFGSNLCVGCGKPLKKGGVCFYHNDKCFKLLEAELNKIGKKKKHKNT